MRQLYAYVANESSLKGCLWAHSFYKHCFYYKFATSEKIEWFVSGTYALLVGYSDISVDIATLTSRVNQQWIISSTFIFSLLDSDENGARFLWRVTKQSNLGQSSRKIFSSPPPASS